MGTLSLVKGNLYNKLPTLNRQTILTKTSNCCLSTLLKPLFSWTTRIKGSQACWDAILSPFAASEDLLAEVVGAADIPDDDYKIRISEEDAQLVLQGFHDACKLKQNTDSELQVNNGSLTLTSAAGQAFNFQVVVNDDESIDLYNVYGNGTIKVIDNDSEGYFINKMMRPTGFRTEEDTPEVLVDDILSSLQWLCVLENVQSGNTIQSALQHLSGLSSGDYNDYLTEIELQCQIQTTHTDILARLSDILAYKTSSAIIQSKGYLQSFGSIIVGLFKSSGINELIVSISDAIRSSTISQFMTSLLTSSKSAFDSVNSLRRGAYDAFHRGGLSGLINFLLGLSKAGSSTVYDEDTGLMKFTDNTQFCPKDFFVGVLNLISSIGSAVAVAIATICHGVLRVVGTVFSVISSVFNNVINAATGLTKAKLLDSDDLVGDSINLPYLPYAFSQAEIAINQFKVSNPSFTEWFINQSATGQTVFYIDVVGGAIFFGPGSFDENSKPTSIRFEFHPLVSNYSAELSNLTSYLQWTHPYDSSKVYTTLSVDSFFNALQSLDPSIDDFQKAFKFLAEEKNEVTSNADDGYLSDSDNWRIFCSTALNTWMFYASCFKQGRVLDLNAFEICLTDEYEFDPDIAPYSNAFWYYLQFAGPIFVPGDVHTPEWGVASNAAIGSIDSSLCVVGWMRSDMAANQYKPNMFIQFYYACDPISHLSQFYDDPNPVPYAFNYSLIPPKYSARSFWTTVILIGSITAVVAAAVVFATVKFAMFARKKRASNVKDFANAQSTWQKAASGVKEVYNPETKSYDIIEFDTNSREGRQYINQCWRAYKLTGLKNNLWQKVVGGSRYDVSSFWGEADDPDRDVREELQAEEAELTSLSASVNDPADLGTGTVVSNETLYRLISGKNFNFSES